MAAGRSKTAEEWQQILWHCVHNIAAPYVIKGAHNVTKDGQDAARQQHGNAEDAERPQKSGSKQYRNARRTNITVHKPQTAAARTGRMMRTQAMASRAANP